MGVATTQQITKYYDLFRDIEVTFTKEIIKATNLDTRQVYLKCTDSQWPCKIHSTSFLAAKIIIGTKSGAFARISKDAVTVNLRFCFQPPDNRSIAFYVTSRVVSILPYENSQDLAIVTLNFTQRPPDDLIEIIGTLLEANANSVKRKNESIIITPDSLRKLHILQKEMMVYIQNVPRRCILRDISFSGTKVMLMGIPNFLKGKDASIRIDFDEPRETIELRGIISHIEEVDHSKSLLAVSIQYNENTVPISYKIHINDYLSQVRKKGPGESEALQNPSSSQVETKQIQAEPALEKVKTGKVIEEMNLTGVEKTVVTASDQNRGI
ncbi:MAG: PilZ domain-containing protein [Spirochaetaceae bacterium]|jgi:hypothetical protein|nr:PilZ domain-containing protein [Spirochaetaceae bacterium]